MSRSKQSRWEDRAAKGKLSTRKLGKLQTLQEAEALRTGVYEPTEQEIQQAAQAGTMQAGTQAQGVAQELAAAQLAGGSQQRGQLTGQMKALGTGVAQAGAGAALNARSLMNQIALQKIEAAKARIMGESQFARQHAAQMTGAIMGGAGQVAGGAGALIDAAGACWVAEELYGVDHPKTHLARFWVMTHDNWFTRLYSKRGQSWAQRLENHPWAKPVVQPIWDVMAFLGLQDIVEVPHASR